MCNSMSSFKVQLDTVGERDDWIFLNSQSPMWTLESCPLVSPFQSKSLQHMDLESGFIACRDCCVGRVIPQYFFFTKTMTAAGQFCWYFLAASLRNPIPEFGERRAQSLVSQVSRESSVGGTGLRNVGLWQRGQIQLLISATTSVGLHLVWTLNKSHFLRLKLAFDNWVVVVTNSGSEFCTGSRVLFCFYFGASNKSARRNPKRIQFQSVAINGVPQTIHGCLRMQGIHLDSQLFVVISWFSFLYCCGFQQW